MSTNGVSYVPFTLAGIMPIASEIPSFATPIFRSIDSDFDYIQSSKKARLIESFVPIPNLASKTDIFVNLNYNEPFGATNQFMIGFIDYEMRPYALSKKDLQYKWDDEFSKYNEYPFLQWTAIRLFKKREWIQRLSDRSVERISAGFFGAKFQEPLNLKSLDFTEIEHVRPIITDREIGWENLISPDNISIRKSMNAKLGRDNKTRRDMLKYNRRGEIVNEMEVKASNRNFSKSISPKNFSKWILHYSGHGYRADPGQLRQNLLRYYDIVKNKPV